MKFVISNYSSYSQTESIYFNTGLNLVEGCESALWNPTEVSLYDILDYTGANILICHGAGIPMDVIHYSNENKRPDLIVNITGISPEDILKIENYLEEEKVNLLFFYTNSFEKTVAKNKKVINIPLGADVFLNTQSSIDYNIDNCYFVDGVNQIQHQENDTYHYLSFQKDLEKQADAIVSVMQMGELYNKYKNIVFKYFNGHIPQAFFDAAYYGNNVIYSLEDKAQQEELEKLLKGVLRCEDLNIETIQPIVRSKHTCLNRIKTMLSQLPCQKSINNIDTLINSYKERFEK